MLVVDAAAGSDVQLTVSVQALALERVDGSVTPNLIEPGATITASDPSGGVAAVQLARIEPGVFVALQIALMEGSVAASLNGQALAVTPSSLLHRVEFDEPLSTVGGESRRVRASYLGGEGRGGRRRGDGGASLILVHDGDLEIVNGVWTPRWELRFGDEGLLQVEVEFVSIDVANNLAQALVPELSQELVDLDFSRRPDLLVGRAVGDELAVLARMTEASSLIVLRLAGEGRGLSDFVEGAITSLSQASSSFEIDRDGTLISFGVEPGTVYLTRSPSGEAQITFADLNVGDDVAVFARRGEDPGDPLIARAVFVLP